MTKHVQAYIHLFVPKMNRVRTLYASHAELDKRKPEKLDQENAEEGLIVEKA